MEYGPSLNQFTPLHERMASAFEGATRAHLGVAYAKTTGASRLLRLRPPTASRVVVGMCFGITYPQAVEHSHPGGVGAKFLERLQVLVRAA